MYETECRIDTISMDDYVDGVNRIIEASFTNGKYDPINYEASVRLVSLMKFAKGSEVAKALGRSTQGLTKEQLRKVADENFVMVWGAEADKIFLRLKKRSQWISMISAANKGIEFRLSELKKRQLSPLDMAKADFFKALTEKISKLDFSEDQLSKLIPPITGDAASEVTNDAENADSTEP